MPRKMRRILRNLLRHVGYDLVRYHPDRLGVDWMEDVTHLSRSPTPLIFDVGANVGQSINNFRRRFRSCTVHSFEPSPDTFHLLSDRYSKVPGVHLWNTAVGSESTELTLNENTVSEMSSLLPLGKQGWGSVQKGTTVPVLTIDSFCINHSIEMIDILKIDTQGFDFEVLKGSRNMIQSGRVGLICIEMIFNDMYNGLPPPCEILEFLREIGCDLVSFYPFHHQQSVASWADALFVHRAYR